MADKDIKWITVNGARIPIKNGQSKKEAVESRFGGNDVKHFASRVPHIHREDVKDMLAFIDAHSSKDKEALAGAVGAKAEHLAEYWGIDLDKGLPGIARAFKQILEGEKKVKPTVKKFRDFWSNL